MKKVIYFLILMVSVVAATAQTISNPTEVSPDSYIYDASYVAIDDSLTNVDTTLYTFRVKGSVEQDFTIKLYLDWVSGTAGGVLTVLQSIDGVNYQAYTDSTITATGVTEDGMEAETIELSGYLYPYMRLQYIQSGTAVTRPKIFVYSKRK